MKGQRQEYKKCNPSRVLYLYYNNALCALTFPTPLPADIRNPVRIFIITPHRLFIQAPQTYISVIDMHRKVQQIYLQSSFDRDLGPDSSARCRCKEIILRLCWEGVGWVPLFKYSSRIQPAIPSLTPYNENEK